MKTSRITKEGRATLGVQRIEKKAPQKDSESPKDEPKKEQMVADLTGSKSDTETKAVSPEPSPSLEETHSSSSAEAKWGTWDGDDLDEADMDEIEPRPAVTDPLSDLENELEQKTIQSTASSPRSGSSLGLPASPRGLHASMPSPLHHALSNGEQENGLNDSDNVGNEADMEANSVRRIRVASRAVQAAGRFQATHLSPPASPRKPRGKSPVSDSEAPPVTQPWLVVTSDDGNDSLLHDKSEASDVAMETRKPWLVVTDGEGSDSLVGDEIPPKVARMDSKPWIVLTNDGGSDALVTDPEKEPETKEQNPESPHPWLVLTDEAGSDALVADEPADGTVEASETKPWIVLTDNDGSDALVTTDRDVVEDHPENDKEKAHPWLVLTDDNGSDSLVTDDEAAGTHVSEMPAIAVIPDSPPHEAENAGWDHDELVFGDEDPDMCSPSPPASVDVVNETSADDGSKDEDKKIEAKAKVINVTEKREKARQARQNRQEQNKKKRERSRKGLGAAKVEEDETKDERPREEAAKETEDEERMKKKEEKRVFEEERLKKEEETRRMKEEAEEVERKKKEEERQEVEKRMVEKERMRVEEEERLRKEEEERKKREEERQRTEEEERKKRAEEERQRKEEEERKKRAEEERQRKEEEERKKRAEEERQRKEKEERKKRAEEERQRKEEEERKRQEIKDEQDRLANLLNSQPPAVMMLLEDLTESTQTAQYLNKLFTSDMQALLAQGRANEAPIPEVDLSFSAEIEGIESTASNMAANSMAVLRGSGHKRVTCAAEAVAAVDVALLEWESDPLAEAYSPFDQTFDTAGLPGVFL